MEGLLDAAGSSRAVVAALIQRIFPAAERHVGGSNYGSSWKRSWREHRRLAHVDNFRFYLEHVEGAALSTFNDAAEAFRLMDEPERFAELMEAFSPSHRLEVLTSLLEFKDTLTADRVMTVPYLLNTLQTLPDERPGMFDPSSSAIVRMLVLALLRKIDDGQHLHVIEALLPSVDWYGGKAHLLNIAGHTEAEGEKLLDTADAERLESEWRCAVRATAPADLATDHEVIRTVWLAQRDAAGEIEWAVPPDAALTLALLRGAVGLSRSQGMGTRRIKSTQRLQWDNLVSIFGSDEAIAERVSHVRSILEAEEPDLLALIDKHIEGWRPDDWD